MEKIFILLIFEMQNPEEKSYAPYVALLAVQFMFGSAPALGKIALTAFPSIAIVGFRVGGAALAFCLLQNLRGGMKLEKSSDYLRFARLSIFGIIANQLFFFTGLSMTTAINTALIAVTIPIFTIAISVIIGKDSLNLKKVCGIILAAAGVIYLIDPQKASFSAGTTLGDIFIVLNSLSYAIYVAFSKDLISKYGALKSIAWIFFFGSLVNIPLGLYSLSSVDVMSVEYKPWLALAGVVIFPTILAYYWVTWAIARVSPGTVAIFVYLQPLLGFMFAVFFLGEQMSWRPVIAAAFIFSGVFLVTRQKSQPVVSDLPAN